MKKIFTIAGLVAAAMLIGAPSAHAIECVPLDPWTETVKHPAEGSETVTVDNPNYQPATEERTEVDGYVMWTWTGGPRNDLPEPPPELGWNQTSAEKACEITDTVYRKGNGRASFFYCETLWVTIPAKDAVGEPFIEVPNPDYVPAWTETIDHQGRECLTDEIANSGSKTPWLLMGGAGVLVAAGVLMMRRRRDA